jgi:hypothetical protein
MMMCRRPDFHPNEGDFRPFDNSRRLGGILTQCLLHRLKRKGFTGHPATLSKDLVVAKERCG